MFCKCLPHVMPLSQSRMLRCFTGSNGSRRRFGVFSWPSSPRLPSFQSAAQQNFCISDSSMKYYFICFVAVLALLLGGAWLVAKNARMTFMSDFDVRLTTKIEM